jgi:hypothetical protein
MLRHGICRITVAINPFKFIDLSTFVTLSGAHNVDHESLLYGYRELREAIIQGERINVDND